MCRTGIDCIMVYGSTKAAASAGGGETNHAWNKVRLDDGKWYNIDVCWSDTGHPYTYDLKSNDFYATHQHWAVTHASW